MEQERKSLQNTAWSTLKVAAKERVVEQAMEAVRNSGSTSHGARSEFENDRDARGSRLVQGGVYVITTPNLSNFIGAYSVEQDGISFTTLLTACKVGTPCILLEASNYKRAWLRGHSKILINEKVCYIESEFLTRFDDYVASR